ncbi:MAG: hypothetical protein U0269_12360 [Polyangiales bacterium]
MKNQVVLLLSLSLAACAPMPMSSGASVVGTWTGRPRDTALYEQRQYRLVFVGSAQSGMFTWQNSGTGKAGGDWSSCVATHTVLGSYTVNGSSLSLTPASGTVTRTGCSNTADNAENAAIPSDSLTDYNDSGTFSIAGSSMTFASMFDGTITFTRQ